MTPPEEILEAEALNKRTDKLKALAKDRILEKFDI